MKTNRKIAGVAAAAMLLPGWGLAHATVSGDGDASGGGDAGIEAPGADAEGEGSAGGSAQLDGAEMPDRGDGGLDDSETPAAPSAPDAPEAPDGPEAPEAPDAPDAPEAPESPGTPEEPEVPESDDGEEDGEGIPMPESATPSASIERESNSQLGVDDDGASAGDERRTEGQVGGTKAETP